MLPCAPRALGESRTRHGDPLSDPPPLIPRRRLRRPDDPGKPSATRAPRPALAPAEDSAVTRLRCTVYELRTFALDAVGAKAIDYERPRVQSSLRPEDFTLQLSGRSGVGRAFDPAGQRLARIDACGLEAALPLAVLVWLRGTEGFTVRSRSYDLRKLLDAARAPADLRPLRLALAASWVAERFVPAERWKRWAAAYSADGQLAWATAAEEAAVVAWESTAPSARR